MAVNGMAHQFITAPEQNPVSSTSRTQTRGPGGPRATADGIWTEIVEQPKQTGLRFRYACEGRSAGSIPGEKSTQDRKSFPTIKIHNYQGVADIFVSCVMKDPPYEPHPHNLVGKDCKRGVCTLKVKDTNVISFPHLGIQCTKKKDVMDNLKQRKEINVDPFQSGFKHIQKANNIDLSVVRLCFQVFLPDENGKITRTIPPVVSHPIHDKKSLKKLIIRRVDKSLGRAKGGDEVFLLCEKIKDDVRIRFYQENSLTNDIEWEDFGDFSPNDIHRQGLIVDFSVKADSVDGLSKYAIVIKTPPYKDQCLSRPEQVKMQLQRQNDSSETSNPMPFIYMPEDPEPMDVDDNIPFNLLASSQFTPTTSSIRTTDNTGIGNMTINVDSLKAQLLSLPENLQNKLLYLYAMQKLQQERAQQQTSSQDFDLSAASSPGLHSNMGVILNDIPMNQSANPEHDTAIFR